MRYTPYTEAQIQSMGVLEEGIYPFEVIEVILTDKSGYDLKDKNGTDMAKLKLMVYDKNNRERIVYTFISGDSNFAYKLRHFAQTIGMIAEYEDGTLNIGRTQGKSGNANIVIKKGTLKADGSGEMWPDRNDVKDFVADSTRIPAGTTPFDAEQDASNNNNELIDSDIPF